MYLEGLALQKDILINIIRNRKIQQTIIYGDHDIYGGENPYQATDLKMGTDEIKITDAYEYSDHICVEGENFNTFSVVFVNDKNVQQWLLMEICLLLKV